jgi:pilus assembly protein CpaF
MVQQTRFSDGTRRITNIAEVVGLGDDGDVELREIFAFKVKKAGERGCIEGEFVASGYLPSFVDEFIAHGLLTDGAVL